MFLDRLERAVDILGLATDGQPGLAVDQLGDSFLEYVKNGDRIIVKENGTITIE